MKQTLKVRPIFLHNDDRVYALLSIVGISLLIFGLIEAQTRAALGPEQQLPGLLPEGRSAKPTGRNILAAFQTPAQPTPGPASNPRSGQLADGGICSER